MEGNSSGSAVAGIRPREGVSLAASLLLTTALVTGGLAWPAGAQEREGGEAYRLAQAERIPFDIPPQELNGAILTFADRTGIQVFYDAARLSGLRSSGVTGTYTPEQALRLLLSGSGVTYRFTDANTVTLERAAAQEDGPAQLAPVTVLGTRRIDVPLSNVPSSITVVGPQEVETQRAMSNSIENILRREVPGFNPTNNGVRSIRGRTAQVFINGVPVNEQLRASSGSDINLITPDQLAFAEVSRGANSAYGFGSPGGIIALSTPRAQSEELTLESRVRASFNPHHPSGSWQTGLYQSASQIVGDFDYHVGGAIAYDGADYDPDGNLALGFEGATASTINGKELTGSLDASFGLDVGDGGQLRLTGTFGYVDFEEQYAIQPGVFRQEFGSLIEQPQGDDSYRQAYTVNLSYEHPDVWGNAVKMELFASDIDTEAYRTVGGRVVRDEQTNEYQGFRSSITTPLDIVHEGTSVAYGFDALRNRYFRPVFFADTGELESFISPDVTLDSYALYGQLDVPVGDVLLTGGARHELYQGEVETAVGTGGIVGGEIDDFDLTLFNAGLVYFLNDDVDLYATFSQGAEISQLGRAARSATTAEEVDPQPAKSDQYEIGLRGEWQPLTLGLAAFYTESDLLSALICDGINPCVPLREPRQFWGVEGSADWTIDEHWGIGGVLTWQDGIRETESGDTRRISSADVPPLLVTAYLDYSPFEWWRNTLQLNYRGSRDEFGDSTAFNEGAVDDVLLVNVAAFFEVGPGELQVGVENLFNTEYVSISGEASNGGFLWLPEEGTRVSVAYSLRW